MKKKLKPQVSDFIKHSSEELATELIEMSEKELQQVVGGKEPITIPTSDSPGPYSPY